MEAGKGQRYSSLRRHYGDILCQEFQYNGRIAAISLKL